MSPYNALALLQDAVYLLRLTFTRCRWLNIESHLTRSECDIFWRVCLSALSSPSVMNG